MNEEEKKKEIVQIVKARLSVMPKEAVLSIGSFGEYDRDQLIKEVEGDTEVGKKVIDIQMQYLQMLKDGVFYDNTVNNQA